MKKLGILLVAFLFICLFVPMASADEFKRAIDIYVEGTIYVDVNTTCDIQTKVGEPDGCYITIENTGNIEDTLLVKGWEIEESAPTQPPGWMDYHFECPGTRGECGSEYSYSDSLYPPEVRNIVLSPDINSTRIYLEVTPYKMGNPVGKIEIRGYSTTNMTEDALGNITVNANPKQAGYGPFAVSGLGNLSLLILGILSTSFFAATKFR